MSDFENIVFDLKQQNKRLLEDLNFERNLNNILENIRNNSLILMQNCKCIENQKIFKVIKQFNNIYTDLKTKQNLLKRYDKQLNDSKHTKRLKHNSVKTTIDRKRAANESINEDINEDISEETAKVETDNTLSHKSDSNLSFSLITELLQMKAINGESSAQHSDNASFPSIEIIEVKDEDNDSPEYQCNQCQQCFDCQTDLNVHTNRVHRRPVQSIPIESQSSTGVHLESVDMSSETMCSTESEANPSNASNTSKAFCFERQTSDRFVCLDCRQVFATKQILLSHQSEAHQMFVYTCDLCDYKTERKQTIGRHREAMHSDQKRYKCPIEGCDRWFKTNHNISAHKKKVHLIFP